MDMGLDFVANSVYLPAVKTTEMNLRSHSNTARNTQIDRVYRVLDLTNMVKIYQCRHGHSPPATDRFDKIKINIVSKKADRIYNKHGCVVIREHRSEDILVIGCGKQPNEAGFLDHEHPNAYTVDVNPMINPSVQMDWHDNTSRDYLKNDFLVLIDEGSFYWMSRHTEKPSDHSKVQTYFRQVAGRIADNGLLILNKKHDHVNKGNLINEKQFEDTSFGPHFKKVDHCTSAAAVAEVVDKHYFRTIPDIEKNLPSQGTSFIVLKKQD